jgi:hypothetical protein
VLTDSCHSGELLEVGFQEVDAERFVSGRLLRKSLKINTSD